MASYTVHFANSKISLIKCSGQSNTTAVASVIISSGINTDVPPRTEPYKYKSSVSLLLSCSLLYPQLFTPFSPISSSSFFPLHSSLLSHLVLSSYLPSSRLSLLILTQAVQLTLSMVLKSTLPPISMHRSLSARVCV